MKEKKYVEISLMDLQKDYVLGLKDKNHYKLVVDMDRIYYDPVERLLTATKILKEVEE